MFSMRRRRHDTGARSIAVYVVIGAVLLAGGAAWMLLHRGGPPEGEGPVSLAAPSPTAALPMTDGEIPPLDLPELSVSDAFVRDVVSGLSAHPQLARWLVTDELIDRFVGSVVDVAGGNSPRSRLTFLIPEEGPSVRESGEDLLMDPVSYARYDLLTEVVTSLDTRGTARLFVQLHPLFEEAYAQLGIPGGSFDDALTLAIGNVLAVSVPTEALEVRQNESVYEFVDPSMESRSPIEKHLVRMGSQNASRIQAKLRQLRDAIAAIGPSGR